MRSQKCAQCGTLLDVSRLEKGSKFACATCGTVLVAGEAAAVRRSLHDSGPAFQPRKSSEPEAPAPRKRRSSPEEREAPARTASSNKPLFLALGALLVVGGVVAAILLNSSGSSPGSSTGGSGAGGAAAGDWWNGVRDSLPVRDAAGLKALIAEAQRRGYDKDEGFWASKRDAIYAALLSRAPEDPDANRHAGRIGIRSLPGFDATWAQMLEHVKVLPPELRDFVARHEASIEADRDVFYEKAAFEGQRALFEKFDAWKKEFEADPSPEQIRKGLAVGEQFAKDFGGAPFLARPFLPFLALRELRAIDKSAEDAKRRESKAAELAPRGRVIASLLTTLAKEFDKRYREPLALPPLENSTVLYQWIFTDPAAYGDQSRAQAEVIARTEGPAFFAPRARWVFAYLPDDPALAANFNESLASAAVQQLLWHYSKEKLENYYPEWGGIWFHLGIAEYLAGMISVSAEGKASVGSGHARRSGHIKLLKESGVPFLTVRQIVEQRTLDSFERWRGDYWHPTLTSSEAVPDSARQLIGAIPDFYFATFLAQSWALNAFLQEHDGGKRRAGYLDLLRTALRGRNKPAGFGSGRWATAFDAFVEIFGLKGAAEWASIEEEYANYLVRVAREAK